MLTNYIHTRFCQTMVHSMGRFQSSMAFMPTLIHSKPVGRNWKKSWKSGFYSEFLGISHCRLLKE